MQTAVPPVSVPLRGFWYSDGFDGSINRFGDEPVSVPLRGFWYSDNVKFEGFEVEMISVSVPLRGFWYSDSFIRHSFARSRWLFQSPYGDFGTLTN